MDRQSGSFTALPSFDSANKHNASFSHSHINSIQEDNEGYLWLASFTEGLHRYHPESGEVKKVDFSDVLGNADSSATPLISRIYKTHEGSICIGFDNRILILSPQDLQINSDVKGIQYHPYDYYGIKRKSLISNNEIDDFSDVPNVIGADEENIWIATRKNGLILHNRNTKENTYFVHDKDKVNSISSNQVVAFGCYKDRRGNLWISFYNSQDFLLNRFNPKDSTFTPFIPGGKNSSNKGSVATAYLEDKNEKLWIFGKFRAFPGDVPGFYCLDTKSGYYDFITYQYSSSQKSDKIFSTSLWTPQFDKEGRIWFIASVWYHGEKGDELLKHLVVYDPIQQSFSHFSLKNPSTGMNTWSHDMEQDHQGNFWIWENYGGLEFSILKKFSPRHKTFEYYSYLNESSPLPNFLEHDINMEVDKQGKLWFFATEYPTIYRFDPVDESWTYQNLKSIEGIESKEIGIAYPEVGEDGEIYMSIADKANDRFYRKGIAHFNPEIFNTQSIIYPDPLITNLVVMGEEQRPDPEGTLK